MELYDVLSSHMEKIRLIGRKIFTRQIIVLFLILCVGAFFRLYRISEYMTFLGDEGRDVLVVKRMIVDHKFTLLGPTASVGGFFMGPLYYYLMLPFLWLWDLDPTGPAVMVALFGIATICIVYKVSSDMFGEAVGVLSSALYALSPIVISYSRSSWNPNLVPFFSLLAIYGLWNITVRNASRWMFVVGLLVGFGIQHHYVFLFLIPVIMLYFVSYRHRVTDFSLYLRGLLGFFVGFSPYLAFEVRHEFTNTRAILRFLMQGNETGFVPETFLGTVSTVVFRLFARLVFRYPEENQFFNYQPWLLTLWQGVVWASVGFTFVIVWFLWNKPLNDNIKATLHSFATLTKTKQRATLLLLLLWFAVPVSLFGLYQREIYIYYFGIFYALPFILISLVLVYMGSLPYLRIPSLILACFLLFVNWQGRPTRWEPNNQLGQTREIARVAYEKANGKPFNFALVTATNSDHAYRYFFEIWGNAPVTIQNEVLDPQRKTVTDQLIVICENPNCQVLGHPLWEIAGFGPAEIVGSWDVPFVRIFKLKHAEEKT